MLKEVLAHVRQYPGITLESLMDLHAADAEYMSALRWFYTVRIRP